MSNRDVVKQTVAEFLRHVEQDNTQCQHRKECVMKYFGKLT